MYRSHNAITRVFILNIEEKKIPNLKKLNKIHLIKIPQKKRVRYFHLKANQVT